MRKGIPAIFLIALVAVTVWSMLSVADEAKKAATAKAEYIGAQKCIVCHKKDGTGPSWEKGVHAHAWEKLSAEQQKNEMCAGCHATGKLPTGEMLTGVQCESCHGAGSLYKPMAIMKDRQKSIDNGLVIPTEETCKKCHNGKNPPECKATPFDFKERVKKGVHDMPPKDAKPAEATGK